MAIGSNARSAAKNPPPARGGARKGNLFQKAVEEMEQGERHPLFDEGRHLVSLVSSAEKEDPWIVVNFEVRDPDDPQRETGDVRSVLFPMAGKAMYVSSKNLVRMVAAFGKMSVEEYQEYDPSGEFANAIATGQPVPDSFGDDTVLGELAWINVTRGKDNPHKPGDWFRNVYFSPYTEGSED